LQAAIDQPGGIAADRITEALRGLDEVVQDVRDHVFAERGEDAHPSHGAGRRPDPRERQGLAAEAASLRLRRTALKQRVTQTAYSLHFVAAQTAALLEQRAELLEQPQRIDYPAETKR
jgi:hypothetical protein